MFQKPEKGRVAKELECCGCACDAVAAHSTGTDDATKRPFCLLGAFTIDGKRQSAKCSVRSWNVSATITEG